MMALATGGCGNNASVTTPSTATSTSSDSFAGALPLQGSSFYSFTVTTAETVSITLVSLTPNTTGAASPAVMRVGLGLPIGIGCAINNSVDTAPGLTTQLSAAVTPETYCVQISDVGNLTAPANFLIRIAHGAPSSSSAAATTTTAFSSFLVTGGSTAHAFPISQGGTVNLTLTSVTPSGVIGLGIGIPSPTGAACSLARSVDASAGSAPQLTVAVEPSTYCVEVYDSGHVAAPGVSFSLTIDHP
jgi:hypothetical protein